MTFADLSIVAELPFGAGLATIYSVGTESGTVDIVEAGSDGIVAVFIRAPS